MQTCGGRVRVVVVDPITLSPFSPAPHLKFQRTLASRQSLTISRIALVLECRAIDLSFYQSGGGRFSEHVSRPPLKAFQLNHYRKNLSATRQSLGNGTHIGFKKAKKMRERQSDCPKIVLVDAIIY